MSIRTDGIANKLKKKHIFSDYYWRQYLGEIPPDAIPGGRDESGRTTYIGQAYIVHESLRSRSAIVPVEIYAGRKSVDIPLFGVRQNTTTDIKVTSAFLF